MTRYFRIWALAAAMSLISTVSIVGPNAHAAPAPPVFRDGYGLTVVKQPRWVENSVRTFVVVVRSTEVPRYAAMAGQIPDEHVLMVTLPEDYAASGGRRFPVQYHLHGHQDFPDSALNQRMFEESTVGGVPLITVAPNGSGRGWYANWIDPPPALGVQNWQNFHLNEVIPFIDANLRTVASREGRAISGHSMGGFGAFHYAESRPELFSYVGSFSGGLDMLNQLQRLSVVGTTQLPESGRPTVSPDAIFGSPVWPFDAAWSMASPAQHVESLRGMGIAMYTGNGSHPLDNPPGAAIESVARQTNLEAQDNLVAAGIPHTFVDYGTGTGWAEGCEGNHADPECLVANMKHFVGLLMDGLAYPRR